MLSYRRQRDCDLEGLKLTEAESNLKGRAASVLKEKYRDYPRRSVALIEVEDGCMYRNGCLEEVGCVRRRKSQGVKERCCRRKRNHVMRKRREIEKRHLRE